jgi:hypothetical protein
MAHNEEGRTPERNHAPEVDLSTETCRTCGRPLRQAKSGWRHEPRHGN